jgi:hypothetical protein
MSELAQNQLNFQEYNQRLGGPSSPIDMETLKQSANEEKEKHAALGMVFDIETSSYVESTVQVKPVEDMSKDLSPMSKDLSPMSKETNKRKASSLDSINMKRMVYEVYTDSPVTDAFPNNYMRISYVGKDTWNTAKEARDVADKLRLNGTENVYVVKSERTMLRNRKSPKKKPTKRVKRVKREKLQSLEDINPPKEWYGSYQPLKGSLKAKGKQMTWWVSDMLKMDGSDFKDQQRAAALMIRRVPAEVVVGWTKTAHILDHEMNCWMLHIDDDNDKDKIRQMTYKIRQSVKIADTESLEDINPPKEWYGSYQPLKGSLEAKGKQMTWWVSDTLQMDGSDTKDQQRAAALMVRCVPAEVVVGWTKTTNVLDDEMNCWMLYIDDDNDKDKIRNMINKIRQSVKIADTKPVSPVSDAALPSSA